MITLLVASMITLAPQDTQVVNGHACDPAQQVCSGLRRVCYTQNYKTVCATAIPRPQPTTVIPTTPAGDAP